MSYTALYRKFRPGTFSEVKGQDHIVVTLQNQIKADRIGHAYLFNGTRGTGKTSVAKIFAKAVNCEQPTDGNPCGVCACCKAISEGVSMNVIEIDAASNNSVDNIREIVEEVKYSPTEGKYKVYIIDEVHMLSTNAFNALLKTLEEPPSYVIFILATTEAHKIPITILSRCQRYDFRRITIDEIAHLLVELSEREGVEAEERALRYIATAADGSMRDALSLLDRCIAFYLGQQLTYDKVLEVLGTIDTTVFLRLCEGVRKGNTVEVLRILEDTVVKGRDLGQFVTDYVWFLRNLLLVRTDASLMETLEISSACREPFLQEAKENTQDQLIRCIRILSELSGQIRYATQKRVLIEIALIKLCHPQMETDTDSLLQRIRVLEQKAAQGVLITASQETVQGEGSRPAPVTEKAPLPKALKEDVKNAAANWDRIMEKMPPALRCTLIKAMPTVDDAGELQLIFEDEIDAKRINRDLQKREVTEVIASVINKEVALSVLSTTETKKPKDWYRDIREIEKKGIPVDIID